MTLGNMRALGVQTVCFILTVPNGP